MMVIIFCGIPGSGKSTIARALVKKMKKLGSYKLFISDKVSGKVYKKIAQFIKDNLSKVDFLIIDATFYKRKWREMVYKLAKGDKTLTVYTHCALGTCLKRNKKRKPHLPEKVIHIISHQFEKPKKPDISINTDKVKLGQAVLRIIRRIKTK